jgi:hypothetical protein
MEPMSGRVEVPLVYEGSVGAVSVRSPPICWTARLPTRPECGTDRGFYTEVGRKHHKRRTQGRMTWPVLMTR